MTTDSILVCDSKGLLHLYEPQGEHNLFFYCGQPYPLNKFASRLPLEALLPPENPLQRLVHLSWFSATKVRDACPICKERSLLILSLRALTGDGTP